MSQNNELKSKCIELQEENQLVQMTAGKKDKSHEKIIKQIEEQCEQEVKHHEEILERMKNDMHLIKD